ncbi:hypothetical protein A9Q84_19155 [Halobacteriovorax marinus]|uniref:histidine kinase n=1 Tax=Halobacteriovorax marinus TaxID=97084 RepID=A0A1Y5F869_9BACT|nr:hypothetical protein A9Q84_19155 [Halobacteriovorax marinus]
MKNNTETIEFSNVTLFPKKSTFLGLLLTTLLVLSITFIIFLTWTTLVEIEEVHFPAIERSAINVRLVNLIDYQFDLAFKTKSKKIVLDLKLNFDSLEQNFKSLSLDKSDSDEEIFKNGKRVITLLNRGKWQEAQSFIEENKFEQKLEDFSFRIFDQTEDMADSRDKNSLRIKSFIDRTIIFSLLIFLFIIYVIIKIYRGYSLNLKERLYAEDKAKQLSKQRKSLIHVLCHDLGNPVSAIHGLIEVAHLIPEKERATILDTIKDNTQVALDIIELTRKMQAIETGKLSLELTPTSFDASLKKSIGILKERIGAKNIEINLLYNPEIKILADETTLVNSILNNILTNSIKFSNDDSKIDISSSEKEEYVEITIRDYGIGMPEHILENVFSETVETSRAGTNGEAGTGFGMPLVKKFIEAYEGHIEIHSSTTGEQKGTISILTFKKA